MNTRKRKESSLSAPAWLERSGPRKFTTCKQVWCRLCVGTPAGHGTYDDKQNPLLLTKRADSAHDSLLRKGWYEQLPAGKPQGSGTTPRRVSAHTLDRGPHSRSPGGVKDAAPPGALADDSSARPPLVYFRMVSMLKHSFL